MKLKSIRIRMKKLKITNRILSIWMFAFLFAYILSFLFEGQVLYSLLDAEKVYTSNYILITIVAHFLGQFTGGLFCRSPQSVRKVEMISLGFCFLMTVSFLFALSGLYILVLIIAGYFAGCAVAAWGYYLMKYTPKNERIKSCADVLIISNTIMIVINVITVNFSIISGLIMSMACPVAGMILLIRLPVEEQTEWTDPTPRSSSNLRKPMGVLFLFVAIITINSGLMYQVINPGFAHLTSLTSWYWAVPYIGALIVMRNLPVRFNRPAFLYVGMAMIMAAFLLFMILGRTRVDYVVIDTLMLGACGIFDLFWWSIIGETLDYAKNPAFVFGIGISANVFGVFIGDVIGLLITTINLQEAQIAVIALCVVCVTLIILPPLNRQLSFLLKSHTYTGTLSGCSFSSSSDPATYSINRNIAAAPIAVTIQNNQIELNCTANVSAVGFILDVETPPSPAFTQTVFGTLPMSQVNTATICAEGDLTAPGTESWIYWDANMAFTNWKLEPRDDTHHCTVTITLSNGVPTANIIVAGSASVRTCSVPLKLN